MRVEFLLKMIEPKTEILVVRKFDGKDGMCVVYDGLVDDVYKSLKDKKVINWNFEKKRKIILI